ncbi:MAG: indole-3-glycerol-phosphate synthase [Gammaproteobacteria bacterium]|nr:indole-3-glycerol-phosphate synthase [Gammaproteobacteria bacterium]TVQ50353.1 MAG: indole-3-glycerol-phosphate synthase [Gammaproteobacteria bacterium]
MAVAGRARVEAARAREPLAALRARAAECPVPPALRLDPRGFDLIAEVKLRSPSAGSLADDTLDPVAQAVSYATAGAAAVSVLTEPREFGGSLAHLEAVAAALGPIGVPAMRKDFLVDVYQLWEARAAGAGGVLLILAMLDNRAVIDLVQAAAEAGLFVLLEAFDGAELERAAMLLPRLAEAEVLLGLNCRDLRSLEVDRQRFEMLRDRFAPGWPSVAESGLASAEDAAWVSGLGYDLALVGSSLMRAAAPGELLAEMLAAGRAA